jgi:AraC-like DNA-binding protein
MKTNSEEPAQEWSTRSIPPTMRADYFAETLSSSLCPMRVELPTKQAFSANMTAAELGPVLVTTWSGEPHQSIRGERELAQSFECDFHLLFQLFSTASLTHRGEVLLHPGDTVLTDSRVCHKLGFRESWAMLNLKLPERWIKQWVPDPQLLVGLKISANSTWGHSLASLAAGLTSMDISQAPLPATVVTDHLGALLAFVVNEVNGRTGGGSKPDVRMLEKIRDYIEEQCHVPDLDAEMLSTQMDVSPGALHSTLRDSGQTFGSLLLEARSNLAKRMLESKFHRHLTTEEIARRAGFMDTSHFSRVMSLRFGQHPTLVGERGNRRGATDS